MPFLQTGNELFTKRISKCSENSNSTSSPLTGVMQITYPGRCNVILEVEDFAWSFDNYDYSFSGIEPGTQHSWEYPIVHSASDRRYDR